MGIKGLSTYLARNSSNFETFRLHNTLVVIDAHNFLNYIYFTHGIYTQFGGEYLHFENLTRRILRNLQRCAIEPIFVFDGCHETLKMPTQLRRARFRLRTCYTMNKLAESHSDPTNGSFCVPILPPLVPVALAQLLRRMHVRYVVADRESDREAASLAIHFNCPVISDDSDFYITTPTTKGSAVCLIPLRWISFEPLSMSKPCSDPCCSSCVPMPSKSSCPPPFGAYLNCQKFLPSGPGLSGLPPAQRPLFAFLAGSDYVPFYGSSAALPILRSLCIPLARKATKEMRTNRRRLVFKHLINWLAGYGDNANECIRRIVSHVPLAQRNAVNLFLLQCLDGYNVDPNMAASALSPFLMSIENTPNNEHPFHHQRDEEADEASPLDDDIFREKRNVCKPPVKSDFLPSLSGSNSNNEDRSSTSSEEDDSALPDRSDSHDVDPHNAVTYSPTITSHWPDKLIRAFRQFDLFPTFLDAVYCQGLVLPCAVEALNQHDSIYTCSTSVRQVIYNLLLGLDACEHERHPPFLFEYARKGTRQMKSFKIPVQPLAVTSVGEKDWRYATIQNFLTSSYEPETTTCAWLHSLALLTSIWHANVSGQNDDPASCVLILALVTLVISCYMLTTGRCPKRGKQADKLKQHFTQCANFFSKQPCSKNSTRLLQLHIIHAFGQFQSMYASLFTLGAVLDALTPSGCVPVKCINLPLVSIVFPTGHLFHSLVSFLSSCSTSERISCIRTNAFTRLLFDDADDVKQAVYLLERFIHWLRLLRQGCRQMNSPVASSTPISLSSFAGPTNSSMVPKKPSTKAKKKSKRQHKTSTPRGKSMAEITAEVERIMLANGLTD